jgi:hypothetical protein
MSSLIVQMQTSIDGFVDSHVPGSRWQLWDWGPNWTWTADARAQFNALFASAAGILLSRPMASEGYLAHWRRTAEHYPNDPDYEFAARIGRMPRLSWPLQLLLTDRLVSRRLGTVLTSVRVRSALAPSIQDRAVYDAAGANVRWAAPPQFASVRLSKSGAVVRRTGRSRASREA